MTKAQLLNQLYNSDLTMRATLVMNYLINRSNAEMTCFPAIKTIANDCNISTRTVQRALKDHLESELIKKDSRYRINGGQSSNLYTLCIIEEIEKEQPSSGQRKNTVDSSYLEKQLEIDNITFEDYYEEIVEEAPIAIDMNVFKDKEVGQIINSGIICFNVANINTHLNSVLLNVCHREGDTLVPP